MSHKSRLSLVLLLLLLSWLGCACSVSQPARVAPQTFPARGVVKELKPDGRTVVIQHDTVSNYMDAMTMPFKVKEQKELAGVKTGDKVSFRLLVTADESWIDHLRKTGRIFSSEAKPALPNTNAVAVAQKRHSLLDYKFTNELEQAVSLSQFKGQALAISFFFTRCPIPDYCPRLSKNFEEASAKLAALPNAPTNWHFLSVSIDPQFDTPKVLRAYAQRYHYDSNHWSFLTGPTNKVEELARQSGVEFERDTAGLFNHGFRMLVINAAGQLQMKYPFGGNLSEAIVADILKAAAVSTNR